jgi:hypothetical protein
VAFNTGCCLLKVAFNTGCCLLMVAINTGYCLLKVAFQGDVTVVFIIMALHQTASMSYIFRIRQSSTLYITYTEMGEHGTTRTTAFDCNWKCTLRLVEKTQIAFCNSYTAFILI